MKKRSIRSGFIITLRISPTRILGSFVECHPDPKTQVAQPDREFLVLPWGLWRYPFPYRVNLFEIIHLVMFCGSRDGFSRERPGLLLGFVLGTRCSQLEPIEFSFELPQL